MKIEDIIGINNAKLIFGNSKDMLNNISKDTRTIKEGDTYIAIKGENFDGNDFYEEAFLKGAKTCIVSNIKELNNDIYKNKNLILVEDTVKFLTQIASKKRENLNIPIIAVTGSVGKTSTKNIIADVLSKKYKVLKTEGNLNTNIGLALTLLSVTDEEFIVLEMGMSAFGEISELTNIAKPDVAVITNIGTSHIGALGSRENILKAKLEILEGLKGELIINNDNDLLSAWYQETKIDNKIITYGIDNQSNYQALNIEYNNSGSSFKLNNDLININVIGKHFIYNSLVAFVIGDLYNIDNALITEKLKHLALEPNRMELINNNDITIINDTYNASYDSVYYALEVLGYYKNRKIAILGDILELGDYSEEIHRNIGKLVLKNNIDILITIGPYSKYINEEAITTGFDINNSYHFNCNKDEIKYINTIKEKNDTMLIKASHGMNFIEIVNSIKE